MKIVDALWNVTLLYIDTAPFIYYTESRANYLSRMRAIFQHIFNNQSSMITSVLTLSECLTKPIREKDQTIITAYIALFQNTQGITLVAVDAQIARKSAELRADYNLRTPDGLHVATAIQTGCGAFLTNDQGLKRISELPILILDELEL